MELSYCLGSQKLRLFSYEMTHLYENTAKSRNAYILERKRLIDTGITTVILCSMKTAISIPDPIFESAEKLAKRLGVSRSQLYSNAVGALLEKYRYCGITEQLDAVYVVNPESSSLEKGFEELQAHALDQDDW
jgi:hypothetical protein